MSDGAWLDVKAEVDRGGSVVDLVRQGSAGKLTCCTTLHHTWCELPFTSDEKLRLYVSTSKKTGLETTA